MGAEEKVPPPNRMRPEGGSLFFKTETKKVAIWSPVPKAPEVLGGGAGGGGGGMLYSG